MHQRSMMRVAVCAAAFVASASTACTGNPSPGDSSYKTGSLGNGGFVFACSDGVACNSFSTGYAASFPKAVALGSTFNVYYVPKDDQNQPALKTPDDAIGTVVSGLPPFFSGGPAGIAATAREGYGALVAERPDGTVVDFTDVQIVKPASIAIYKSNAGILGNDAQDVGATYSMKVGATDLFRAVAKGEDSQVLAGSLAVDWESSDTGTLSIALNDGQATFTALKAGSVTVTLNKAAIAKTLTVTVTP